MDESTNNLRFLSTDKEARAARFAAYRLTKHLLEPIFDNAVMRMISAGIRYENASLLKDTLKHWRG